MQGRPFRFLCLPHISIGLKQGTSLVGISVGGVAVNDNPPPNTTKNGNSGNYTEVLGFSKLKSRPVRSEAQLPRAVLPEQIPFSDVPPNHLHTAVAGLVHDAPFRGPCNRRGRSMPSP